MCIGFRTDSISSLAFVVTSVFTASGTPGRVDRDGIDIPRFFAIVSTVLLLTSHVAIALAYALRMCAHASLSTLHWLPSKPVARLALGGSA
jgi:hypothetical protein